jgi:hypothetical protein
MKALPPTSDMNHMFVTSPPFLVTSFMYSIKEFLFLTSPRTRVFVESSPQCKLIVDPYLEDRHVCLDITNDEDHLILVSSFFYSDLY